MIKHWESQPTSLVDVDAGANDCGIAVSVGGPTLTGIFCRSCGVTLYAARGACVHCGVRLRGTRRRLSGRGEIYSFTRSGSSQSDPEVILVMVRSEEGPLVTGKLHTLGGAVPHIGMPVELTAAEHDSAAGWAFRPCSASLPQGACHE